MLQLGRELPEVAGQEASYCDPKGLNYNKRMLSETEINIFIDSMLRHGNSSGNASALRVLMPEKVIKSAIRICIEYK